MPLNASNRKDVNIPSGFGIFGVVLNIDPHPRAVKEGWNTEIERAASTSPASADIQLAARVSADRRTVEDDQVQSTTSGFFWRARHVKAGSTAGNFTDWVNGNPREDSGGTFNPSFPSLQEKDDFERLRGRSSSKMNYSSTGGETVKGRLARVTNVTLAVNSSTGNGNSGDDIYQVDWDADSALSTNATVDITCFREGSFTTQVTGIKATTGTRDIDTNQNTTDTNTSHSAKVELSSTAGTNWMSVDGITKQTIV